MRVLQVIARMNVGGTARYLDTLVRGLEERGHHIQLATGFVQGDEVEDGCVDDLPIVRVEHMGRALDPRTDLLARRELSGIVKAFRPDIIHSHTFKAGLLARTIAGSIPHVHTYHGHPFVDPEFSGAKARVIAGIERVLARRADVLASVGERVSRDLIAKGVGSDAKFVNLPPAIEPLVLQPRVAARQEFGIPQDAVVVGWLGRMIPVKAPERVLELARELPQVTFLMGGGGPLLERTRAAAPANVRVLGWASATTVYGAADLALLTSVSEGMPVALIEAQMAGLPVLCTDVGSAGEVVLHEETGLVSSPEGLADTLTRLVADPALRARMGESARTSAVERFSPAQMASAHLAVYERLVAGR